MKRLVLIALLALAGTAAGSAQTSCLGCHGDSDMVDEEMLEVVTSFAHDVHGEVGLSCHDCHGGNPDPDLAEDLFAAKDPEFAAAPFVGAPAATEIPSFCGRCHSDPVYMKRFRPDARVDQEREYWTSQHGELLAQGDERVATCSSCHGVHGIRRSGDSKSPVYPSRVAETCRTCHADPEHMAGYLLPDGRPLPVDQYAKWRRSVHAAALLQKEDLFAPTCNDCHGNHGAAPPGLESVTFVCGQCHGREAGLFRGSPKHDGFLEHNELFLPEMGEDGCAECHEPPASGFPVLTHFSECASCHGNHGIVRPTVALLAPLPEVPCALCHEDGGLLAQDLTEPEEKRRSYEEQRDFLVEEARAAGLEGDDLFDALIDSTLGLSVHTLPGSGEGGAEPALRPAFARLFEKFRIGKTYYNYVDPASGEQVRQKLIRCTDCHNEEGSPGREAARTLLEQQQQLTVLSARAERLLLSARRGGVEVGDAVLALDRAVDNEIELQVLVHAFATGEGTAFAAKQAEGLGHAREAMVAGREALHELVVRRRGLAISLFFILLVLIGLALKIRQLSAAEQAAAAREAKS